MKGIPWRVIGVVALFLFANGAKAEDLDCNIGPLQRTIGGNEWQVYSCTDGESLVFVSVPHSSAHPFHFLLSDQSGEMQISGEGNGSQIATKAAYDELTQFSDQDRRALIRETRAGTTNPQEN